MARLVGLKVNFVNKRALGCAADDETQIMTQSHSANAHVVLTHQTSSFTQSLSTFYGSPSIFLTVL